MAYNTTAQIRSYCNMAASTPPDATIERWQVLIDALIVQYNSSPDTSIAAIIEGNRIAYLYHNGRNPQPQLGNISDIKPLTEAEKEMLQVEDIMVDAIPMDGKRSWEV